MSADDKADPARPGDAQEAAAPLELDQASINFIEDFASAWDFAKTARMDGRVLGLLMISEQPYLSAKSIADLLRASAGAVSMSTRNLASVGFIKRHTVPGDRRHYFRVEDDVWGTFLAGERTYLRQLASIIESGLTIHPGPSGRPHTRLRNASRYMTWLEGYHRKMLADWRAYRDSLDADDGPPPPEKT